MTITPPIFVLDNGAVDAYNSVSKAELEYEPWIVEEELEFFDATGQRLTVLSSWVPGRPYEISLVLSEDHRTDAPAYLAEHLRNSLIQRVKRGIVAGDQLLDDDLTLENWVRRYVKLGLVE